MKVYPSNITEVFEYNKLLDKLSNYCLSKLGKQRVQRMRFLNKLDIIKLLLDQTTEFKNILIHKEAFPTSDYIDLTRELNLLQIDNAVLKEIDFIHIKTVCKVIDSFYYFFKNRAQQYPNLYAISQETINEQQIIKEIDWIIDPDGTVKSTASPDLLKIRKELSRSRSEADKVYNHLINKYKKQGYITEEVNESIRNERRVIVIDSSYKSFIGGIHHDISSTGKATFIEPSEVIPINNKIIELERDERKEIYKILKELSKKISGYITILKTHQLVIEKYDFTRAKALLAIAMNATQPSLNNQSVLKVVNAYHPVLLLANNETNKQTIPFSFHLNNTKHILVISGPNAGGKTICMKAVGLLVMMLHAGILIPVHESSEFGLFSNLMVDMGDTQSIEFELSTYSARLKNMNLFLKRAYKDTLLLIDEFGTGTDPLLGGALAEAILEEFHKQKTFAVITTHYLNLKLIGEKLKGIVNGAMSYNPSTLTPLFQLKIGKPGSSFTFAVAEKIGLPPAIIKTAKELADDTSIRMDDLLNKLEKEVLQASNENQKLAIEKEKLEKAIDKYKKLLEENKNEHFKETIKTQKHKLHQLESLEQRVNRMANGFLKGKGKEKLNVVNQFIKSINFSAQSIKDEVVTASVDDVINKKIALGDIVRVKSTKMSGMVVEIQDKKVHIQFGGLKTIADIKNVDVIG